MGRVASPEGPFVMVSPAPFFMLTRAPNIDDVTTITRPPDSKHGSTIPPDERSLAVQAKATLALMFTTKMASLTPLFIFTGVQLVMWASWYVKALHCGGVCGADVERVECSWSCGPADTSVFTN